MALNSGLMTGGRTCDQCGRVYFPGGAPAVAEFHRTGRCLRAALADEPPQPILEGPAVLCKRCGDSGARPDERGVQLVLCDCAAGAALAAVRRPYGTTQPGDVVRR